MKTSPCGGERHKSSTARLPPFSPLCRMAHVAVLVKISHHVLHLGGRGGRKLNFSLICLFCDSVSALLLRWQSQQEQNRKKDFRIQEAKNSNDSTLEKKKYNKRQKSKNSSLPPFYHPLPGWGRRGWPLSYLRCRRHCVLWIKSDSTLPRFVARSRLHVGSGGFQLPEIYLTPRGARPKM